MNMSRQKRTLMDFPWSMFVDTNGAFGPKNGGAIAYALVLCVTWASMSSCAFEAQPPIDAQFACSVNADCPETLKCFRASGLCTPIASECLRASTDIEFLVPLADGTLCASGLCVNGACVAPACGDGFVSPPEECDDGQKRLSGECNPDCTLNVCGDGFVYVGVEECDDGNDVNGDGCDDGCLITRCGNGVVTDSESCDDGNDVDGDGCDRNCTLTGCGNGVLSAGESCDDGNLLSGDGCDSNCRPTGCGNGVVALDEECDDENDVDADVCTNACRFPRCGDGILHAGESCDDGNNVDADECRNDCRPNICGDGVRNPRLEECDDGNTSNFDACLTTCRENRCGDGFRDPALEECDDGNRKDEDSCLRSCVLNVCGDGYLNPTGEDCDDGNLLSGDACTAICTVNVCGDGDLDPSRETCDDGNRDSGDGCRSDCNKVEVCGDGLPDVGEDCDDANENPRDGCWSCRNQSWSGEWLVGGRRPNWDASTTVLAVPNGVVVDADGNVIFSNVGAHQVLQMSPDGQVRVVAGVGFAATVDDDPIRTLRAGLTAPRGLALAPNGDLLIAESGGNRIRRINQNGFLRTVAGRYEADDPPAWGREGVAAIEVDLHSPYDVDVDDLGRIYIAELGEHLLRVVGLDGEINTLAGGGDVELTAENSGVLLARDAALSEIASVSLDKRGRVFLAEPYAHRVLRVDKDGTISIVAGDGTRGYSGDNGDALSAQLAGPFGVHVDENDSLWIADQFNHRIRRVSFLENGTSLITTVAGGGELEVTSGASSLQAKLESPRGLFVTSEGELWFTEVGGHRVSQLTSDGTVRLRVGTGEWAAPLDGEFSLAADIKTVFGLALDDEGTLYFGDTDHHLLFRKAEDQAVQRVAGTYFRGWNIENEALKSPLDNPRGMAFASDGSLYFADLQNHCVRRFRWLGEEGVLEQAVGRCDFDEGAFGGDGNLAINARLRVPHDVFVERNPAGDVLWIADTGNHAIRRVPISQDGNPTLIETYVGGPNATTTAIGAFRTNYELRMPAGVIVDDEGRVYISEYRAHRVVRVDPDNNVQLVAGTGESGFNGDSGLASTSPLEGPVGLALAPSGELYIAEFNGARIRRVENPRAQNATIETFAGTGDLASYGDEGPAIDAAVVPLGIRFAPNGDLFIADEDRVRRIEMQGEQQGTIHTAVGGLYFQNAFGPSSDVILVESVQMARVGPYLLSSSGKSGYVHGFDLEGGTAAPLIGYPKASVLVQNQAKYSPLMSHTAGLYFDAASSKLFITDAGDLTNRGAYSSALRIVNVPKAADGTWMPPDRWTQETKGVSRGTLSKQVFDLDIAADIESEVPPIEVSVGQSVMLRLISLSPTPDPVFEMRAQLEAPPTSLRYDCTTRSDVQGDECELQIPEGVSVLHLRVHGAVAGAVQVQVDIDDEVPWRNLWGMTAANDPEYLFVADAGAACIRRIRKDGKPAGVVYGVCGEPGVAIELLHVPADVLFSPFSGALYIADSANHRVLRLSNPAGEEPWLTELVVGDGTPSSAGRGQPADRFPVESPSSLGMDDWGNLYIASDTTVRVVANVDGDEDADGDDLVMNVLDVSHPLLQDLGSPDCMSALTLDDQGDLYVSDRCEGFIMKLSPTTTP